VIGQITLDAATHAGAAVIAPQDVYVDLQRHADVE
jgi:hypothetical protein